MQYPPKFKGTILNYFDNSAILAESVHHMKSTFLAGVFDNRGVVREAYRAFGILVRHLPGVPKAQKASETRSKVMLPGLPAAVCIPP